MNQVTVTKTKKWGIIPWYTFHSTVYATHPGIQVRLSIRELIQADIAQALLKDEETYPKAVTGFGDLGALLSTSMVTQNGEQWRYSPSPQEFIVSSRNSKPPGLISSNYRYY